jgi:D-3-phosphoglycerate dehydrogenase
MSQQKTTSFPKERINILFLENISDAAIRLFKQNGYVNVRKITGALGEQELMRELKDVHLLGIRSKTRISKKVLAAAPKLQAIGCFCIGVNQVDLQAATEAGVVVFNAPYSNTRSVAELVIGAAIMLIRRIPDKNKAAHEGIWMKEAKGSFELRGKTMGIIGYGNIGSQVSVLAEALGMKVLFHDIETRLPLGNAEAAKNLKDLVSRADVISLHVPETELTKNLINRSVLKSTKQGAIVINYARGEVVDLDALATALVQESIGGAAIDVYPFEFQYLERGITAGSHSVPALSLPPVENAHRILHIHKNVPGVLTAINAALSGNHINIVGQYLTTNSLIGYVVLDVDKRLSQKAMGLLKEVKHTIKVRVLY